MTYLIWAWVVWVGGNLALMLFATSRVPSCIGGRVVVPGWLAELLTTAEIAAVEAHERGHRHYGHTWKNFALVCAFMRASKGRRERQELEADDYAAREVGAEHVSSALRKLSTHPFDLYRADRILRLTA